MHWLGDSLDGTLARVRKTERPRYGYYLDHLVDAFATARSASVSGSPVHVAVGRPGDRDRLPDPVDQHLPRDARLRCVHAGYGRLGPTEARVLLIAVNTALALGAAIRHPGRARDRPRGTDDRRAGGTRRPQPRAGSVSSSRSRRAGRASGPPPAGGSPAGGGPGRAWSRAPDLLELGEVLVHHLVDQRSPRPDRGERAARGCITQSGTSGAHCPPVAGDLELDGEAPDQLDDLELRWRVPSPGGTSGRAGGTGSRLRGKSFRTRARLADHAAIQRSPLLAHRGLGHSGLDSSGGPSSTDPRSRGWPGGCGIRSRGQPPRPRRSPDWPRRTRARLPLRASSPPRAGSGG